MALNSDIAHFYAHYGTEVVVRNGKIVTGDAVITVTDSDDQPRDGLRIRGDLALLWGPPTRPRVAFPFPSLPADIELLFPSQSGTLALLSDISGAESSFTFDDLLALVLAMPVPRSEWLAFAGFNGATTEFVDALAFDCDPAKGVPLLQQTGIGPLIHDETGSPVYGQFHLYGTGLRSVKYGAAPKANQRVHASYFS